MNTLIIQADFQTYWHIGTGKGAGQGVDALVEKDLLGLPQVSGKMLKGLFRDACFKLEKWEQLSEEATTPSLTEQLFGSRTDTTRFTTQSGRLHFSALRLPEPERQAMLDAYKPLLYKTLHSTAIDHESGTAKDKSLRAMEVAIPLTVVGEISWIEDAVNAIDESQTLKDSWPEILEKCATLITHIGAQKTRGLGEVQLTLLKPDC